MTALRPLFHTLLATLCLVAMASGKSAHAQKIYSAKYQSQADLKVFFTDKEYRAGWKNKSKQHLLY